MNHSAKLKVSAIASAFEAHCESQYFDWEINSISNLQLVDGFTVASVSYTVGKKRKHTLVARWSYRFEESEGRVIAYYHDQAELSAS